MPEALPWWLFAVLSAVFAALTAILAKVGIQDVPSNLGTAIRTAVVLLFTWALVFVRGEHRGIAQLTSRTWVFLSLSALATGLSWLAYYRALQLGPASQVAPIDKLSVALTVVLAWLVLGEPISARTAAGAVLIVGGVLLCIK